MVSRLSSWVAAGLIVSGSASASSATKRACDLISKAEIEKIVRSTVETPRPNDPPPDASGARLSSCHWKTPGSMLHSETIDLTLRTAPGPVRGLSDQIRTLLSGGNGKWQEPIIASSEHSFSSTVHTLMGTNAELHLMKNGGAVYIQASARGKGADTIIMERAKTVAVMALSRVK